MMPTKAPANPILRRRPALYSAALLLPACTALLLSGCGLPRRQPAARVDDEQLAQIAPIIEKEIADGSFPGAVVLVGQADRTLYCRAFGNAVVEPFESPMHETTIFDLASLSKPIATAASVLILVDRGRIRLDAPVGDYLSAFASNGKEGAQIRHLLSHTSGLPAYTDAAALRTEHGPICPDAVIDKICSLQAQSPPGEQFRYSCLGYILLARIVEEVSGQPLDRFARDNIFAPLGMHDTTYNPPPSQQDRIAAATVRDGRPLRGQVHDPLASLMGGVSGNAGVFSTASDLARYCRMLLNGGRANGRQILSDQALTLLTAEQSHGRAYGFDVDSPYAWIRGDHAGPRAFCHSGYTGTSLVCDPDTQTYLILLTNRVHPSDKGSTRQARTALANLIWPTPCAPQPDEPSRAQ